jgi:hypothetical protein
VRPHLERESLLTVVDAPPEGPVEADLHLHHLANDPRHAFVLRALRQRPGLVLLEEWDVHRLVMEETAGRGDRAAWHTAARRAGGESGAFVAELLERGPVPAWLSALLPLAATELEDAVAVAAFTSDGYARLRALGADHPIAHLPLPLLAATAPAERPAARRGPADRPVVAVLLPGSAAARERVEAALAGLAGVVRRDLPPGDAAAAILAAADVLVALDEPGDGRLDPVLGLALAAGVPTLVTAGSPAAGELPEGVVARVSPGGTEAAELRALVSRLAGDPALRARMGALARAHAAAVADPARAAADLLALARTAVAARALRPSPDRPALSPLAADALEELRWAARSAGLPDSPSEAAALVGSLFPPR